MFYWLYDIPVLALVFLFALMFVGCLFVCGHVDRIVVSRYVVIGPRSNIPRALIVVAPRSRLYDCELFTSLLTFGWIVGTSDALCFLFDTNGFDE